MAFSPFSESARIERLNYYVENESLFVYLSDTLESIDCHHQQFTKIEMWDDAKELAKELLSTKRPDLIVKELLSSSLKNYTSRGCNNRDDTFVGVYFSTNLQPADVNRITKSVLISLYAIIYYQYKIREEFAHLSLLVDKIKVITGMGQCFENVESLVYKGISEGEIIPDYDYSKDEEHQFKDNGDNSKIETITFEKKDQKGNMTTKTITTGEISEIVMKYPWKKGMTKLQMQKMLSEITGLSEASFQKGLVE